MDTSLYIFNSNRTIREALQALNEQKSLALTLFLVDSNEKMIGTLTDGDIRRFLVAGGNLETRVAEAMNRDFKFISLNITNSVKQLREYKKRGIIKLLPVLDINGKIIDIYDLVNFKSYLPVDAVLMAGGKGERLRPLTQNCPKPLLKIGDKAIIDRNINALANNGIRNISVTINYLKEQLIEHYAQPLENGVKVECVAEDQFFGTIGALKLVKEFHNDTILVMNSDLLTDIDYEDFYLHFQENEAMMSAAAIPYTISVPYGIFNLDGRDIKGVHEKPVYNLYANAGIYLIKKEALKYIPEGQMFNATDLIDTLAADGQKVVRYPLTGLWIDIGTPEEYRKAQELIKHLK